MEEVDHADNVDIIDDHGYIEDVIHTEEEFVDTEFHTVEDDEDFNEVVSHFRKKEVPLLQLTNGEDMVSADIIGDEQFDNLEDDFGYDSELHSDDDVEENQQFPEFSTDKDVNNPYFVMGMKFTSFAQFKKAVISWGIKNRWQPKFKPNDRIRCCAKCKTKEDCPFHIWASKVGGRDPTVQIKSVQLQHNCEKVENNFHMTSAYLAPIYVERFRSDPNWAEKGLIDQVQRDTGYIIKHIKAWRVKNECLKMIYGDGDKKYSKLFAYRKEILKTNPGSTVEIWRECFRFKGFYICLSPLKEAFKKGIRSIVCVDGCWLKKGNYGCQLLSAVALDPNDMIFPIAWAVVEKEDKETWMWFLDLVGADLQINSAGFSFMSDRQKGLVGAIKELYPLAEHRNCVRHMYTNFRGKHKGKELKDLIWNAARSTYVQRFNQWMNALEMTDNEAREWFNNPDRQLGVWSRAFFRERARCDILLNNPCECFNRYILDTRDKPIITMLEMIKNRIMKRLYTKRLIGQRWNFNICPKPAKKLDENKVFSFNYYATHSGGNQLMVEGGGGPYVVDIKEWSCSCRKWQISGIPCAHACAAIRTHNGLYENYVHKCYRRETYLEVYSEVINPTNNEELWDDDGFGHNTIPPALFLFLPSWQNIISANQNEQGCNDRGDEGLGITTQEER